jgi:hypothetical protein
VYKVGTCVVVSSIEDGYELNIGKIQLLLVDRNSNLFFIVEINKFKLISCLSLYEQNASELSEYQCISVSDLVSRTPVSVYTLNGKKLISLKVIN